MTKEMVFQIMLIALVAVAPLAIVMIFAFLRGYTVDLHMSRGERRRRRLFKRENHESDDV